MTRVLRKHPTRCSTSGRSRPAIGTPTATSAWPAWRPSTIAHTASVAMKTVTPSSRHRARSRWRSPAGTTKLDLAPLVAEHGRAGTVEGQRELLQPVEGLPPVRQLLARRPRRARCDAANSAKSAYWMGSSGRSTGVAAEQAGVQRRDLAAEHLHRPAVGHDVVDREQEHVGSRDGAGRAWCAAAVPGRGRRAGRRGPRPARRRLRGWSTAGTAVRSTSSSGTWSSGAIRCTGSPLDRPRRWSAGRRGGRRPRRCCAPARARRTGPGISMAAAST